MRKPEKNWKNIFWTKFLLWGNPKIKTPKIIHRRNPRELIVNWKLTPKLKKTKERNKRILSKIDISVENLNLKNSQADKQTIMPIRIDKVLFERKRTLRAITNAIDIPLTTLFNSIFKNLKVRFFSKPSISFWILFQG